MMIKTLKQTVATVAAVVLALGVSACTPEVPLVSETTPLSNETIDEQRAWVEREADAAVIASGIADGWHQRGHVPEENIAWSGLPEDRSQVIGRLSPIECSGAGTGAFNLGLNNDIAVADVTAIADGMRVFWESEGWTISDITPPSSNEVYFRADREGGAILGFRATPTGLLIRVTSTCSAHASVANAFGASGVANAFEAELATREPAMADLELSEIYLRGAANSLVDRLHADNMYSTMAGGDQTAGVGLRAVAESAESIGKIISGGTP